MELFLFLFLLIFFNILTRSENKLEKINVPKIEKLKDNQQKKPPESSPEINWVSVLNWVRHEEARRGAFDFGYDGITQYPGHPLSTVHPGR